MFGFGKKSATKAREQVGYDAGRQFMETVITHVKEKMPAVCGWYINLLITRLKEAQDDPELTRLAWDGFKTALQDVPRIVEENIRQQYAEGWDFYKSAGMDHILSSIIRQEVAAFTDPLPDQILAQITGGQAV